MAASDANDTMMCSVGGGAAGALATGLSGVWPAGADAAASSVGAAGGALGLLLAAPPPPHAASASAAPPSATRAALRLRLPPIRSLAVTGSYRLGCQPL